MAEVADTLERMRKLKNQRERAQAKVESLTAELADVVRELSQAGIPDTKLARDLGVSRQTVRVWAAKDDWRRQYQARREGGKA